jgi:hypothetical protein
VAGGAADFAMNIERPTSNAQQRMAASRGIVQRSMFDVRCSMFVFTAILFATLRLFGQASTNMPPTLSPAYPEIPLTFGERFSPTTQSGQAIYISIVLLAVLLFFVIWKKLHPPPPPTLPPEMVARAALAKLLRQPEDGKHLSEVSQILRRYVIAAFELPPGEFTTAEFSAALAGTEKIGAELAQTISNFLRECDERKFSPSNPDMPVNAANRALQIINLAEQQRQKSEGAKHE